MRPPSLGFGYRVADDVTWRSWLAGSAAVGDAQLEVVKHRLRVADRRPGQCPGRVRPRPGGRPRGGALARRAASGTAARRAGARRPPRRCPCPPRRRPPCRRPPCRCRARRRPRRRRQRPTRSSSPFSRSWLDLTGYPRDLLDLDLDLEADLGVDTVKQAEVFAAVRERFGIPREENLRLRDFPTLAHVIGFVRDRAPGAQTAPADVQPAAGTRRAVPSQPMPSQLRLQPPPAAAESAPPAAADTVTDQIVQIVSDMTGYPADLLDLDLDLEADLGIDTVKQAEMFAAVRERFGIPRDENLRLRDFPTLTHVIGFARDRAPAAAARRSRPAPGSAPSPPFPR